MTPVFFDVTVPINLLFLAGAQAQISASQLVAVETPWLVFRLARLLLVRMRTFA